MGRVVAVTNIKGGIGKTTTVVNVGAGLALMGARVLLVDVDAQGNLAIALGITPKRTIYDVLVDGTPATKCIISARPHLDLLAANDTLLGAQPAISRRSDWARVLDLALQPIKQSYDFIIIDSPGSLSVLNVNALMAANEVLVPTTVEHLSIKGLALLLKQVARITAGSCIVRMIVPTMFDPRLKQAHTMLSQIQATYGSTVTTPVRVNVRLSEAAWHGKTIYEYDANSRGALDYAQLVKNLTDAWEFQPAAKKFTQQSQSAQPSGQEQSPSSGAILSSSTSPATTSVSGEMPAPHITATSAGGTVSTGVSVSADTAAATNGQPSAPTGTTSLPFKCPYCGHILRRTTLAGYRVAYCDNCRYKQQELATFKR
jgi:chromosome partitioning protein